jgi:serine/threonine-protein kinase RsbT
VTAPDADVIAIRRDDDVVRVRQEVRRRALAMGFSLVEQTKLVTAASELARNTLVHGGGGEATIGQLRHGELEGIQLTFRDEGPGIPDVEQALRDGFTTGSGLGLGLGGARRLVSALTIDSAPDRGTCITAVKWR